MRRQFLRIINAVCAVAAAIGIAGFGSSAALAVSGGGPATSGDWPAVVALINAGAPNAFDGQFCGGTLIRTDWVLTAAHCAVRDDGLTPNDPSAIKVAAGIDDLNVVTPASTYDVDRVAVYPLYAGRPYTYDLALLHLTRPVPNIAPATIGFGWYATSPYAASAWLAGWGDAGDGYPNLLQQGQIAVSSRGACGASFGVQGVICGTVPGSNEAAACHGDSGGPLMDFRYGAEVIGIVSFGLGYCEPGMTSAFTDVGSYHSWIAWVSRGRDPSISQPVISRFSARDLGHVINLRANWCQAGGGTRSIRVDYMFFQGRIWSAGRTRDPVIQQRGSSPYACTSAQISVPDKYRNGTWRLQVKVTDQATGLQSTTDFPASFRIRNP